MNDATAVPAVARVLLSTVLHHLDTDDETCTTADIPVGATDLQGYLDELLSEITTSDQ